MLMLNRRFQILFDDEQFARVHAAAQARKISAAEVICTDVDACLISGSSEAMERYVQEFHPEKASKTTVKKTVKRDVNQPVNGRGVTTTT